jgi:hypothetical protein
MGVSVAVGLDVPVGSGVLLGAMVGGGTVAHVGSVSTVAGWIGSLAGVHAASMLISKQAWNIVLKTRERYMCILSAVILHQSQSDRSLKDLSDN